jgi:hypothetical protein
MEDSLIAANGIRVGVSSQCMKGERIRSQQTGEFHLLTFSCCRRRSYFESAAAMDLFEDALERVRRRSLLAVAGYVVMPECLEIRAARPMVIFARSKARETGDCGREDSSRLCRVLCFSFRRDTVPRADALRHFSFKLSSLRGRARFKTSWENRNLRGEASRHI